MYIDVIFITRPHVYLFHFDYLQIKDRRDEIDDTMTVNFYWSREHAFVLLNPIVCCISKTECIKAESKPEENLPSYQC